MRIEGRTGYAMSAIRPVGKCPGLSDYPVGCRDRALIDVSNSVKTPYMLDIWFHIV